MGSSRRGTNERHRSSRVLSNQARVERHTLQLGAGLCKGRFTGRKKSGLRGILNEETSLCVLVVISSPPEADCSRPPIPGPRSPQAPLSRSDQTSSRPNGAQAVPMNGWEAIDWFSTARGTGTGGLWGNAKQASFSPSNFAGSGTEGWSEEPFSRACNSSQVTGRQKKRRIENRIMRDVSRPSIIALQHFRP